MSGLEAEIDSARVAAADPGAKGFRDRAARRRALGRSRSATNYKDIGSDYRDVMSNTLIRMFIGYDPREAVSFSVHAHSIQRHASRPVAVIPLMLSQLGGLLWRERHPKQSTDFSFSRFLAPYLSDFEGWSLFTDCDMIVRDDVAKLWDLRDDRFAVMCVKHNHVPKESVKFFGQLQTRYEKKNWSSVMLFNNARCTALTPDYVNTASGLELHQFKWLQDDSLIGELPASWNHLVGEDVPCQDAKLVHFTIGGPYFSEYHGCEFTDQWLAEKEAMLRCDQRDT